MGMKLAEDDGLATAPDPREYPFFAIAAQRKNKRKKDTA